MQTESVCTVAGCKGRVKGHGLCGMHYQRFRHHGSTDRQPGSKAELRGVPIQERFWTKVDKQGEGCWLWTAHRSKGGYGQFEYKHPGKSWGPALAHRVAWILTHGEIPVGLFVCHTCDVRLCVNPQHLFLGTAKDNMQDMYSKGRQVPYAVFTANRARGERTSTAKLTEDQVREIRQLYAAGGVSQQALADRFGIYQTKISALIRRQTWKHVI